MLTQDYLRDFELARSKHALDEKAVVWIGRQKFILLDEVILIFICC